MPTVREPSKRVMNFEQADRLPILESEPWWDKTIERWRKEGLPNELEDDYSIRRHFGLDPLRELVYYTYPPGLALPQNDKKNGKQTDVVHTSRGGMCKESGEPVVQTVDDYLRLKKDILYPQTGFYPDELHECKERHENGDSILTFDIGGFFWHPRQLFGIEPHFTHFMVSPR